MSAPNPLPRYIYKIRDQEPTSWDEVSSLDQRDGFIHTSTSVQLAGTADRFFSKYRTLWLLRINIDDVTDILKWEENKPGGLVYPHLYHQDLQQAIPASAEVLKWVRQHNESWTTAGENSKQLEY